MRRLLALVAAAAHALALKTQGVGGARLALLDFSGAMRGGKRRGGGSRFSGADFDENLWYGASASDELFRAFAPGIPKNSSLHRLDFKGLNQFFGEVTAMQLKRDRVRAHVWGRVTARFNAIAEKCEGVWDI